MRARSNPLESVVYIQSQVPERAMTAEILGTERSGHGVRIREDGLIATVGYLVLEAEHIWIRSRERRPILLPRTLIPALPC